MHPSNSLRESREETATARRALLLTVARREMIVDVGLIVVKIAVGLEKIAMKDIVTAIIATSSKPH